MFWIEWYMLFFWGGGHNGKVMLLLIDKIGGYHCFWGCFDNITVVCFSFTWYILSKSTKVLNPLLKIPLSKYANIAHSHENGSSSGFFVLWSNNPCSLHKICNRVNFLLDLDKIYTDIYSFLYFWLQIHTTFAPQRPKNTVKWRVRSAIHDFFKDTFPSKCNF